MTYTYRGDRWTRSPLRGRACEAIRRADGKCIRGRGSMLVRFADGVVAVVLARQLRKVPGDWNSVLGSPDRIT
ncbi:MAG TPA: hypothetical protein VF219_08955 [Vicinamibacterales bacterium]